MPNTEQLNGIGALMQKDAVKELLKIIMEEIANGIPEIISDLPVDISTEEEFPEEFNAYVDFLEEELGIPVKIVSVGPDREQTIVRYEE